MHLNSICRLVCRRPSPLYREGKCGDVICGHGWSVGIAATLAGGHGGFQEIWRKKRDGLFAKQSIFINLYLLNGKKNPLVKNKVIYFPHSAVYFYLLHLY